MKERDISSLWYSIPAIHPAGFPFIAIFVAITVGLFFLWQPLGWVGVVLSAWCVYFFRNPERVSPDHPDVVVSPADGIVCRIDRATPPAELGMVVTSCLRICVFMNVFNVHVNRVPMAGRVVRLAYRPGKFFNASLDKASEFNERMSICLEVAPGREIAAVQIAGLVARRIKCDLVEGQRVETGERFGLIRFGSRLDVYLPEGTEPQVSIGQTMVAGETVLAYLKKVETP